MLLSKRLDIDFTRFLTADYQHSRHTCLHHHKRELKDIHDRYQGFPDEYNVDNTAIYQLWWSQDQIDYQEIGRQLGIEVKTVSSIRQKPAGVIPWHRDTFYQIHQTADHDLTSSIMVRANVHLEHYKMGHFIQYKRMEDKDYTTFTNWRAGDCLIWDDQVEHLGANCGFEDKLTLQVPGFYRPVCS